MSINKGLPITEPTRNPAQEERPSYAVACLAMQTESCQSKNTIAHTQALKQILKHDILSHYYLRCGPASYNNGELSGIERCR